MGEWFFLQLVVETLKNYTKWRDKYFYPKSHKPSLVWSWEYRLIREYLQELNIWILETGDIYKHSNWCVILAWRILKLGNSAQLLLVAGWGQRVVEKACTASFRHGKERCATHSQRGTAGMGQGWNQERWEESDLRKITRS